MRGKRLYRALLAGGVAGFLATAGACSYRSTYVAPQDGRPRVVWSKDNDPAVELSGLSPTGECAAELGRLIGRASVRTNQSTTLELNSVPVYARYSMAGGYWTPRYYGPPILIGTPGLGPPLLRPPLFSPGLRGGHGVAATGRSGSSGHIGSIGGGRSSGRFGSFGSGGGGGGDKAVGAVVMAVAVIALIALPIIDVSLAMSPAESPSLSAQATDMVNAYNDLLRSPGSPCSEYAVAPPLAPEAEVAP